MYQDMLWLVRTCKLQVKGGKKKKRASTQAVRRPENYGVQVHPSPLNFPPASQSKETMCSHCPDRVAWSQDADPRIRVALRTVVSCLPFSDSEVCCQLQKL